VKSKFKFYYVGGLVRDSFLGVKSKDVDLVCVCPSFEELEAEIKSLGGEIFLSKPEYFTIRCNMPNVGPCDIRLARKDGEYSDGRRPDKVEVASSLIEDLSTRDFTINAMAQDLETGELIDPYNGQADLQHSTLRCVGDAQERFTEDGLRILRAIRFAVTKNMTFDSDIDYCLSESRFFIPRLEKIAVERIQQELYKACQFNTLTTLELFDKYHDLRQWVFLYTPIWLEPTLKQK
jgi:tRNA nucleotidyltransferase (CCA-adding enzyme)